MNQEIWNVRFSVKSDNTQCLCREKMMGWPPLYQEWFRCNHPENGMGECQHINCPLKIEEQEEWAN